MLANTLTTECCQKILTNVLARRPWTVARVARTIGNVSEYVRRIRSGEQSFQLSDVELLAKACRKEPHELIFETIDPEKLTDHERGLYDLGVRELERHRRFKKIMSRKPVKKRRVRSSAA